jgi:hypothetical protein
MGHNGELGARTKPIGLDNYSLFHFNPTMDLPDTRGIKKCGLAGLSDFRDSSRLVPKYGLSTAAVSVSWKKAVVPTPLDYRLRTFLLWQELYGDPNTPVVQFEVTTLSIILELWRFKFL